MNQEVLVNKTNHLSVFFTAEETTFELSLIFERYNAKDVIQCELDTFFTGEFLTNENKFDIEDIIWHLAKETRNRQHFEKEKNASNLSLRNQSKSTQTGEISASLSSFESTAGGIFTDKNLRDSQLSPSSWDKTGDTLRISCTILA